MHMTTCWHYLSVYPVDLFDGKQCSHVFLLCQFEIVTISCRTAPGGPGQKLVWVVVDRMP